MPANRFNANTELGIGIGLRIPHYQHILKNKPTVDWFEIISENYMCDGGRPLEVLDQILEQYQVIQHGVSLYFGSTDRIDREQLKRLKNSGQADQDARSSPIISAGAAWMGRYTHDLLPMPYTFAAAKNTAQQVREVQDFLEVPISVENCQQLRGVSRFGNDRVGISHRSGRTGRLRDSAGREQHLRLQQEPQFRSIRLSEQRPAPPSRADAHRGAQQIREIHSRHARSSGARPGVENVRPRDPQMRADVHAAGMGCAHPVLRGGAQGSAEGEEISGCGSKIARTTRPWPPRPHEHGYHRQTSPDIWPNCGGCSGSPARSS